MAILNYSMKEIDQIDKVQREALCDMFSFPRNSSANTLRIVSGIVKMERRQNLLRANFIARQLETEKDPSTLLPRINRWVKSTGLVSHLDKMKKKSNFELTPYHEANELIIKDLHQRHMNWNQRLVANAVHPIRKIISFAATPKSGWTLFQICLNWNAFISMLRNSLG